MTDDAATAPTLPPLDPERLAWHEVSMAHAALAADLDEASIDGIIARLGAVRAALLAGEKKRAVRLVDYFAGSQKLPRKARLALEQMREQASAA